ncbi:unnamed protein product [Musa acuminata subsp. burmannicoides]
MFNFGFQHLTLLNFISLWRMKDLYLPVHYQSVLDVTWLFSLQEIGKRLFFSKLFLSWNLDGAGIIT